MAKDNKDIENELHEDDLDQTDELSTVFEKEKPQKVTKVKEEKEVVIKEVKPQLIVGETDHLAPITISKEMKKSFLEYAMSVIVSRALPDARDGLKPVHRRILYGMYDLGVTSKSAHKKSARIVGDVLGKYHPHGDSSVYEAMVRMSQDFSMRYPLVDGHGNFGSIDGDGAAAMRYTEARMSKIAGLMVQGIRKNTVDFIPNYDGSEIEPEVLPARMPNLLVTGATGIAVGMATSIPPHNLGEVIDGVIALARNPEITIDELIKIIPAPDFPTGGVIMGTASAVNAYTTGNGSTLVRSKTEIEELQSGKNRIIVTEIPYMVNKAKMIEKIAHYVRNKVIEGISDLRDESSREGMRIVIELKKGVVPEVVLNKLFKITQMQTNFSMNMLALDRGQPKVMNLKEILAVYLNHQIKVIRRRTKFDLEKAEARIEVLIGLDIAITNIDAVIKIIKSASNDSVAHEKLMGKFRLTEIQAKSITDMRLGRLTGLAIDKMREEKAILDEEIKGLKAILDDKKLLLEVIIGELDEVRDKFADERRSEIVEVHGSIDDEDLIPVKEVAISMSTKGYVKRISLEEYNTQHRGGVGSKSMSTYEDDNVEKIITASTHSDLLVFSSSGKVFRIRAHQIPEMSKQAKGTPFVNIIDINKKEKVVSMLTTNEYKDNEYLITVTKNGVIKKTAMTEYSRINKNGKRALKLKEGDELIRAMVVKNGVDIIIGCSSGKVARFSSDEVRPMGRSAAGVKGMTLEEGSEVIGTSFSEPNGRYILSLGKDGFGKLTPIDEYRKTKRGAKGVKSIDVTKAGKLIFVRIVSGVEDIIVITKKGITIRTSLSEVSTIGRSAKGVKIIDVQAGNPIKAATIFNTTQIQEAVEEAIRKTQEINLSELNKESLDFEKAIAEADEEQSKSMVIDISTLSEEEFVKEKLIDDEEEN